MITALGGNHKYKLSPDEYVLGAITLYLYIINLVSSFMGDNSM
ncbi:hypothetical protein HaLaN_10840 [Haematococcus lacustris]|uniref:Uncharacterized protein n=1 Tax=Haematococcus lacustris TaxID=44745 RepID=A0A699YYU1_HAELA|nr:hypothetical protein HaLaN_10840 [Haematococcus lacustris]